MVTAKSGQLYDPNQSYRLLSLTESHGVFTTARSADPGVSTASALDWARRSGEHNRCSNFKMDDVIKTVENDILTGRLQTFSSLQDLLADLDAPE